MKLTELLLLAIIGWSALGTLGAVISLHGGRRAEARRHLAWLAAVLSAYLAALMLVSALQSQRDVAIGQDQCFGRMCFTVTGIDELPGLVSGDPGRVLRVAIRVSNRGVEADEDPNLQVFLLDSQRRVWQPLPGLSGNFLSATVAGRSEMVSRPMFRIARDSTGLGLVFTHGTFQLRRLIIGDTESLRHRPAIVALGR